MSKRESRRGGSSQRARVRGKEGDFFSSCKPFQLCSGLRTEAGSERKRGTGNAWHFVSFSPRSREKEDGREREGSVPWDCLPGRR